MDSDLYKSNTQLLDALHLEDPNIQANFLVTIVGITDGTYFIKVEDTLSHPVEPNGKALEGKKINDYEEWLQTITATAKKVFNTEKIVIN